MSIIKTVDLTKSYGKNRGMENVSLEVKEGEIFGFIGPNGAGKSTFIRTILNFLYPTSGSGTVLGMDIERDSSEIKKQIGYVPSEVKYYDEITSTELIEYAMSFHPETDREELKNLSEQLKLDMGKKIGELSLGNKKKIAIAQALVTRPKLLILDEPTSGLDPLIQKKLFSILRAEKERGNTVFLSSHNLNEVESLCDRVAIIREGKIVDTIDLNEIRKGFGLTIELDGDVKKEEIEKISGNMISSENGSYVFTYKGDINEFLDWAKEYRFKKLLIKEQNLENTFMQYYTGKDVESDERI